VAARKRSRFWLWGSLGAVVALVVLVGAVVAHSSGTKIEGSRIGTVSRMDIAKSVVATGKVQPITKVEVKSKASGIVEKWYVDANAHVHRGQVLAQLDQQEILAQVAAQKATLQAAEANVKTAEANITQDEVTARAPDLPMYESALRRNQEMKAAGIVSEQVLENADRDYLSMLNKQRTAVATVTVDRAKLQQAQAQVAQSEASLKQLEEQLSYTTVVSPIDGVVLSRDVEIGDAVSSILVLGSTATLVFTLGDTTQVYVDGKVDEADIGSVYMGQHARIRIESFKNRTFSGKVTRIAPLGVEKDNVTTFSVRVSIDNPTGEIKAMMTANAEILIDEHKNVIAAPEQAISYDAQKHALVNVPDPKAKDGMRKVAVTVGLANGSNTEITSGLKEGDKVVLQQ
jgi:HlyD family secretion protein